MLNSSPVASSQFVLCYYINVTSKIQVPKISNVANWDFESVVFPGERMYVLNTRRALMDISTYTHEAAVLSQILCEGLQLDCSDRLVKGANVASRIGVNHSTPSVLELNHELTEL
ncbi:MAG: DUF1830 domain-containing protein [Tolypothrix sp. Co-bin9]|nr:DUF1830 domain-containing protein [Tolypothrix sp. Co-bin9]